MEELVQTREKRQASAQRLYHVKGKVQNKIAKFEELRVKSEALNVYIEIGRNGRQIG